MKSRSILLIMLISTSFLFSFSISNLCEAGASIELREFYQDGSNYVITVYCNHKSTLEFFWKEQEANQGAYQLIGTLNAPNYGNLFSIRWDITDLSDGNYTILVRSTETELEQNVSINKAHWEISPVILQYLGSVTARYKGDIEGTVDVHPHGGTIAPYSQYFIFDKQDETTFRVTSLQIDDSVLNTIYLELYSHGQKWGTLTYQINDDTLEVRVIFPGFKDFQPGSQSQQSQPQEQQPEQPPEQQTEEMKQILEQLSQIQQQNQNLTQQVTNMTSQQAEKDTKISELQNEIDEVKKQSTEKEKELELQRQQESQRYLLYAAGIAVGGGAGAAYVFSKRQTTPIPVQKPRDFVHGPPFKPSAGMGIEEEKIPTLVLLSANEQNLDPFELNRLVNAEKAVRPHLSTEKALNSVINKLKEQGEI